MLSLILSSNILVSIHASSREDATRDIERLFESPCFNPRVLAGGRDLLRVGGYNGSGGFNPRVLAGGRDNVNCEQQRAAEVSIHASSREDATVSVESNINQNVTFAKARRK